MKKIKLLAAVAAFAPLALHAQSADPVIMEVGGTQIRQSEFMKEFENSVGRSLKSKPHVSASEKREALNEYVNLYANFRAKDLDARALGFDTARYMLLELARYRRDLAAPYLIDSIVLKDILRQAYERNHYVLHAAHILVRLRPDADPADTLAAYNRALELRKRVVGGESIFNVAAEEVLRVNPEARVTSYEGDLGYFTVFDMVYPFENAAYSLAVKEVSQPVRTRFGYHIIQILDKAEHFGKVTIQHIWVNSGNAKAAISNMYDRLMNGTPFEMVARQSEDHSTAETGGYITDANVNQLPAEYVKKITTMQPGEISAPFYTRYGWHIIKLVKKDTLPPFESMDGYYRQRLTRDPRGESSRRSFAENARKKYGIQDLTTTPVPVKGKRKKGAKVEMMASLDEIRSHLNDSIFQGIWRCKDSNFHDLSTVVRMPGKEYNTLDVVRHIRVNQKSESKVSIDRYLQRVYEDFLDSITIAYADSQLETEYPEFAALVDEYRRGLMIFNYNDQMIWSKAIKDSVGFANFYATESKKKSLSNPDDSIYFWHTRARVVTFDVADSACLAPEKAVKLVAKALDKKTASSDIRDLLAKKVNKKKCGAEEPVTFNVEMVERGRQQLLAKGQWTPGVYPVAAKKGYRLVVVEEVLPPMLKGQMEARGYYLNAWQNEVERQLNDELRSKYNVKINWDAVKKINL